MDPSVKFGLQFEAAPAPEEQAPEQEVAAPEPEEAGDDNGQVVTLDNFRRK